MSQKELIEGLSLDYIKTNHWVVIMASMLNGSNMEQVVDWVMLKATRQNNDF
jgi:hypothetical protein